MRCGLRICDACELPFDCIVTDADGAPYLRYHNHKMKREALVPIDAQLVEMITVHQQSLHNHWPPGTPVLFPRPRKNPDGREPTGTSTYRTALYRWLVRCDIRDEHALPVVLKPHQWRHTLGTRMINRDVPQEVVRRILDHDSTEMTAHYAPPSRSTPTARGSPSTRTDHSQTRHGPGNACPEPPRPYRTAAARCRQCRPAGTPTRV